MTQAIATDEENTPDSLWETLLYYIQCIVPMFGSAKRIAEKHTLNREEHFHLQGWLFRCEELFRRLLFIDALKIVALFDPDAEKKQRDEPALQRTTARERTAFDPDHPETWQVSFSLISCEPPASRLAAPKPSAEAGRHGSSHEERCRQDAGGPRSSTRLPPLGPQLSEWVIRTAEPKVITLADLMRGHGAPASSPACLLATGAASERWFAGEDAGAPYLYDAYPLARRIEALDRATQHRERHIQRMARWLAKNARQALRFTLPTLSFQRGLTRPGDHAVNDASRLATRAFAAIVAFCDSS